MKKTRIDWLKRTLATALTAAMLLSAVPGTAFGVASATPPQMWDFSSATGFVGKQVDERTRGDVTMSAQITSGNLTVQGTHKGDPAAPAQIYQTLYDNLSIPVTADTRLSYHTIPRLGSGSISGSNYDSDCYSLHIALDLKFSDGTYLSGLGVEDENAVLMDPNSQGEAKAQYYNQDNLIIADLSALAGKTITDILVGYANENDLKNTTLVTTNYKTQIDNIRIEHTRKVYNSLAEYVNVLRGTNNGGYGGSNTNPNGPREFSRGLTGPMVAVPHGFNFWAPENAGSGDDIFRYTNNYIDNIRASHEPSVWVGERGRWTFMVDSGGSGNNVYNPDTLVSNAHYFSADFTSGKAKNTKLEFSPTDHGVAARFTYDAGLSKRGVNFGALRDFSATKGGNSFTATVAAGNNGMPASFVYGEFDKPIDSVSGANLTFAPARSGNTVVNMKLATSYISADQAKANFNQELADKSFDTITTTAKALWNEKLGIIEIEGASEDQMISFYSNMYRLFLYPNNMGEYTGKGNDEGWQYRSPYTKSVEDGKLYYNNGFWDTYRTTWAAYSLLTPEMNSEMLNGLLQHFEDGDWIPRWIAPAGTNSMVGTSSDVIFGDAIMRGAELTEDQWATAYKAALKNGAMSAGSSAAGGRSDLNTGIFLGYTPGTAHEKMSWAMEGYINDAGIANLAKALGDEDGYEYYLSRATNYVNLFDPTPYQAYTGGWFKGKESNGNFSGGFNPISWGNAYTETNGWNMAFSTPQDGQGLANLYGGQENLAKKLDEFFAPSNTNYLAGGYGNTIHEMREAQEVKLGQYGHSNQPSHHIPYMYLYAGRPDRTQEIVRAVLRQNYIGSQIGQGYAGDEDNGEMSGWYIFSALGMYPVDMGSGQLAFGSPLFTKATIHHENGHDLVISAPNNGRDNIYVGGLTINGVPYNSTSILQTDLTDRLKTENVTLTFDMKSTPQNWGKDAPPPSITEGTEIADPLRDKTVSEVTALTSAPDFSTGVATASAYSDGVTNLKNLFDNNSTNSAKLTPVEGKASVLYCFPEATAVSLYTLTSGQDKAKAPASFALYGSNDGETWTELDSRGGVSFDWKTYTKPFLTQTPAFVRFTYFRLDIFSDNEIELAELELMSRTLPDLDEDFLAELITQAGETKGELTTGGYARLATLLDDAISAAQTVADNSSATPSDIVSACEALAEAIADASRLTDLWTELEEAKAINAGDMPDSVSVPLAVAVAAADAATASGTFATMKTARSGLRLAIENVALCTDLDAKLAEAAAIANGLQQKVLSDLLSDAIDQAHTVRTSKTTTTAELRSATAALAQSMKDIPGLASLWTLLAEAKTIDTTDKVELLVNSLKAAIAAAEEATKTATTAEELLAARSALEKAVTNINLAKLRAGYEQIIAVSADENKGLSVDSGNPGNWGDVNPGEWARYDGLVFDGNGANRVRVNYSQASDAAGSLAIYIDSLDSEPVCVMNLPNNGNNWGTYKDIYGDFEVPVSGVHTVYLYTIGANNKPYVANLKYLQFYEAAIASIAGTVDTADLGLDLTTITAKLYKASAPQTAVASVALDAQGKFSFTDLSSGAYEVALDGLSEDFSPIREAVQVSGAEPTPLALRLKGNAKVTVEIEDWAYGEEPSAPNCANVNGTDGTWVLTYTGRNETTYDASETVPTKAGEYTLTATYDSADFKGFDTVDFTINKAERTLTINGWDDPILLPDTLTAQIEVVTDTDANADGDAEPNPDAAVTTFASSDHTAISVDETGLVTALRNGKAEITVSIAETPNYQAAEEKLSVRAIASPLVDVVVTADNVPKILQISASIVGETVYLTGFVTAGTTLVLEPKCPDEELVGVDVTAAVSEDQSKVVVTVSDAAAGLEKSYTYTVDYSRVIELPDNMEVELSEPEISLGEFGPIAWLMEPMEIPSLATAMPPETIPAAEALLTEELKAEGYDTVVIQVYPKAELMSYEEQASVVLNFTAMYTILAKKSAETRAEAHSDKIMLLESTDVAETIVLLEPTEMTELTAPVTVSVGLPYLFAADNAVHLFHVGDEEKTPMPVSVSEGIAAFTTEALGQFEFYTDARSTTVNFTHYSGATETKTYTVDNLGDKLPTDSRSGYIFVAWSIDGRVYTTVTEALLDVNATVAATPSFVEKENNSGNSGGGGSSVASYTIAASAGKGGTISPSGNVIIYKNADKIFTITPDAGYLIADVLVDGKSVGAVKQYIFESVTTGHRIEAMFKMSPTVALSFTDVAEDDWFYDAVCFVTGKGLFNGTSEDSFSPEVGMSRAMLLTVLARLDGQDTTKGDRWDTVGVEWAKEQGISDGSSPETAVSREQLAVMLYRYAKAEKVENDMKGFSDADSVSDWAAEAMQWAVSDGILNGVNGKLNPTATASRAEVATILERFVMLP